MTNAMRPDLVERLWSQISSHVADDLGYCLEAAVRANAPLFLVGGAVRDLLLGNSPAWDIDVVTNVDVKSMLESVDRFVHRVTFHERFGTATIPKSLDVVRARRETYSRPGALPDVEFADIEDDLKRRDFTINAMALRVTEPVGELLDPLGGQADLESHVIRALHEDSFRDDATRMIRAVRYAARLDCAIEPVTERWLTDALPYVDAVTGPRLDHEMTRCFTVSSVGKAMRLARELGVLKAIHPGLDASDETLTRWTPPYGKAWVTGYNVLLQPPDDAVAASLIQRLQLSSEQQEALTETVRLETLSPQLEAAYDDPVAVVTLLHGARSFAIRALAIRHGGGVERACHGYLTWWRNVMPALRGNELIALGMKQGPAVGEMLWALRLARLRGEVETRDGEIELVKRELGVRGG